MATSCGDFDPAAEGPPEGLDAVQRALSSISCTESKDTGYVQGKPFTITVVTVDGKKVETKTANAYYVMAQAAAKAGVNIKVVSGFRTMASQTYLYNCYKNCNCNSCNLAAKPGYSNHQSGHALDLNTSVSSVLTWLNKHGGSYGFKRTVPSESWHWEWWGGGPGGGPCGKPTYPQLTIKQTMTSISGQERDLCTDGESKGIFDWWEGQKTELLVDVKNRGSAVAKEVKIGLWADEPSVEISRWKIYSDYKQPSGSFKLNDTDGMQSIPHDSPGASFKLWLGSLSVGETKRIKLTVAAKSFSLGEADHAQLRAWVATIEGYYKKSGFSGAPSLNLKSYQTQNGGDLRAAFSSDVLAEERCDGVDNDCDQEVDEACAAEADATLPGQDAGVSLADPDAGMSGDGGYDHSEDTSAGGGCSLAGGTARAPLSALLVLLLCLALRRRESN